VADSSWQKEKEERGSLKSGKNGEISQKATGKQEKHIDRTGLKQYNLVCAMINTQTVV